MKQEYADFDVLLERRGDAYVVRVVDSPVGRVDPEPFVPPDVSGLPTLVQHMSALRRISPATTDETAEPAWEAPQEFGTRLFDALFTGRIRFALRNSQYVAAGKHLGLRLRLNFVTTPELASLPWELLYDGERHYFPCRQRPSPTVRVVELPDPAAPLELAGPIRMLVVISSPYNLHPLDVETEWLKLEEALQPLIEMGRIELVRLAGASLEALRAAVTESDFHVFHFMGHGGVNDKTGEGQLAFTRSSGEAQFEPSSHLADVLAGSPIELAVLNSCEGGRVTAIDPYGSSALMLVERGIQAVVAMQFEISDDAAKAFSGVLYRQVAEGEGIDFAVTAARQAILTSSPSEWATPVLYLRADASKLFVPKQPKPPKPPNGELHPAAPSPESPRIVGAGARGATVSLAWFQPYVAGAAVTQWEVSRNGVPHAVVYQPGFVDTPGAPGVYTYAVVARTDDQRQSSPSAEATVKVRGRLHRWFFTDRGRPRVLVWLFTGLMVFSFIVSMIVGGNPVTTPTNVRVVSADPVTLVWDDETLWTPVYEWEVYRDDQLVGTTRTPRWRDPGPPPGGHRYSIVALDSSGRRSAAATVLVAPSSGATP